MVQVHEFALSDIELVVYQSKVIAVVRKDQVKYNQLLQIEYFAYNLQLFQIPVILILNKNYKQIINR